MLGKGVFPLLSNLKGVCVSVKDLVADIEQAGVSRHHIETDVQARLRDAGITVPPRKECDEAAVKPFAYLGVSVLKHNLGSYYSLLAVSLEQKVFSSAAPSSKTTAKTWKTSRVGAEDLRRIWQALRALVDQFIREFIKLNPPP